MKTVEKDFFRWLVDGKDPASEEPLRDYEFCVLEFCEAIGDRNKVFVDVGACVGKYTVPMSFRYGEVVAIEPNPQNVRLLTKNIELNRCRNVRVLELAVLDRRGTARLRLAGAQSRIGGEGVEVRTATLDDVVERADVIKIDVEGAELHVVRGARRLIEQHKPTFVIEHNEYWIQEEPTTHREILKLLRAKGYLAFDYNFMHWIYVHRDAFGTLPSHVRGRLVANHVFYEVIVRNLREGRNWYYSLPETWWWGMSILEFHEKLRERALRSGAWLKLVDATVRRLEGS
ncbi:MAG: FkbM family methyltransferase [Candidatus Alkanophagales archaeon]